MIDFESAKKPREQSADAYVALQSIGVKIDAVRAEMRLTSTVERRSKLQQEYAALQLQWDTAVSNYLAAQSRLIVYDVDDLAAI